MTDASMQRLNMVESQVRPSDVTDRRLIRAMGQVPRELYVPDALKPVAYMDSPLPLQADAAGRPMRQLLPPRTFAKLVNAADIPANGVVLDAACGMGYSTAVLAHIARRVIGVEPDAALADTARAILNTAGVTNAVIHTGPIAAGKPAESPYDVILINGAVPEVPRSLLDQLKDGGRLVVIIGHAAAGKAVVWSRSGATYDCREVFDATAALLPGFELTRKFAL